MTRSWLTATRRPCSPITTCPTAWYFEPLTFEDVLEIYEAEKKMGPIKGVIVQLGGQTPLSLAARLKAAGVPIGTTPESIDRRKP